MQTLMSLVFIKLLLFTCIAIASEGAETSAAGFSLEEKPRWEFGLGGGYLDDFDYPASKDRNRAGVLLPFLIYRSENFRFSGRNVSAVALEASRFRVDFSVGAALNADSDGNSARQGMPDLDFLLEFGPQLIVRLIDKQTRNGRSLVNWRNRLRAVFSTDFDSIATRGWLFQSQLQGTQQQLMGHKDVDGIALLNLTWATEKLHDYYYQVDPEFETPVRPQYDAAGGFLGANLFVGLAYRPTPRLRIFGGLRQGYFRGSANEDSPLFESTANTGFAIGLVWTLLQSDERIGVLDDE